MAASMIRACCLRLVSSQRKIASSSFVGQVRCTFQEQDLSFQHNISRSFTSQENQGKVIKIKRDHVFEKVLTDSDANVHHHICAVLIGKKRKTLNKFILETGIKFNVHTTDDGYVLVSGKNGEVVEKAVEITTSHINKIKREVQSLVTEKILTDEEEEMRYIICGLLIGKGGENISRIKSENGLKFQCSSTSDGHVLVRGTDAEVVKTAVEVVTREIKKIRNDRGLFD